MTFIKIVVSYTLPDFTERTPREHREKTAPTPHLKKVLFLNIAFLKRLTKILKKFTPFLKHLASCTSFAFLRTPLYPLTPNLIRVFHAFTPYALHFYTKNICVSAKNVVILQRNSKVLVCRHINIALLLFRVQEKSLRN